MQKTYISIDLGGTKCAGAVVTESGEIIYKMKDKRRSSWYLKAFLLFLSIHSICVGIALITFPIPLISQFGIDICNKFFPTQSGVLHIIMGIIYILAIKNLGKNDLLIIFSIIVKFIATVFLVLYFLFLDQILVILLSGIGDFLMGVVLLMLFRAFKKMQVME